MKSPEEIKKLLACDIAQENGWCEVVGACKKCEYYVANNFTDENTVDALAYIQQLERERDALLADLTTACADVPNPCTVCGHYRTDWERPGCELIGLTCEWVWRGVSEVKIDE